MAVTITVTDILRNAAQLIGVPPFAANTNVTDAQALFWLQESLESLQALNAQKLGSDHHHISSVRLNTQPNVNFLSLPSDSIEVFDVIWMRGPEQYIRLCPAEAQYVLPIGADPKMWEELTPRFRLEGTTLVFFPAPLKAYPVTIWYGQWFGAAASSASVQGRLDWRQWLELDLAVKCLVKKRRLVDVGDMTQRRDALSAQLFAPGRQRMRAGPSRIQDVDPSLVSRWWWMA